MVAAPTPVEIFCSYAHEDEAWLRKLETHLSLLKRQGLVSLWHDRLIVPGTDWVKTINTHLETASVILLLVSADFFASDYCYGIEMQRVIARHEAGEARVVPLLVRPVDWKDTPFAHLHALPTNARPLSTWQDEDTALTDVVAGICRVLEDLPLLAASIPRAALPAIWNVPYPRNPFFLGRESEFAQMRQRLQAGQATALSQPQAISGLGGIGKTQVALEYAYRYHQDYREVLWAYADSIEGLVSSYIAIASLLQLPEREAREQKVIVQAVKAWLQTHRNWLLILDNADELTLLADFLPPSLQGHLLLTTRATATGRFAHRLEIGTLLPEHGALFLLRRASLIAPDATLEQASLEERKLALRISQELGGLPLALDQAGAYLEETGADLVSYWRIYQQHRTDLLQKRRGLVTDHPAPVATTWLLSFQRIEERSPAAADLLRLLAFLPPDSIHEKILTLGASWLGPLLSSVTANDFLLDQAVETLLAYSMVQRDPRKKILSIHRLVQVVVQDTLTVEEKDIWAERALFATHVVLPVIEHDSLQEQKLASLGLQILQLESAPTNSLTFSLSAQGNLYKAYSKYAEAELLYQQALHFGKQRLELDHFDVAYPVKALGELYKEQGKYAEAEPLYQYALEIMERQWGSEDISIITPLHELARFYKERGKYTEAEPLYQRALRMFEQQHMPEQPFVSYLLNELASLYLQQGRYAEAELLYQRALRIWEPQLEYEYPDLEAAETMHGLAQLREAQGNREEAKSLYIRALTMSEQSFEVYHFKSSLVTVSDRILEVYRLKITEIRQRLIALLHAMGQYEEAAQLELVQSEP